MPTESAIFASQTSNGTIFRDDPAHLRWMLEDLVSSDRHTLRAHFEAAVRIAAPEVDRKVFAAAFLHDRATVASSDVVKHFQSHLHAALSAFVAKHAAAELLAEPSEPALKAVVAAAERVAFDCGLELIHPMRLNFESPSVQRDRMQEVARARLEQQSLIEVQQLRRATELLDQIEELRLKSPGLSAGRILQQLNPPDAATALSNMLRVSCAAETVAIFAVSGLMLCRVNVHSVDDDAGAVGELAQFPLPDTLGPLRSVNPCIIDDQPRLLVGARSGVFVVDPSNLGAIRTFPCGEIQSQLGFNCAIMDGRNILASHSEIGVVGWSLDAPATLSTILPRPGARFVTSLAPGVFAFATGSQLHISRSGADETAESASRADVVGLIVESGRLIAVHKDGTVAIYSKSSGELLEKKSRQATTVCAGAIPFAGSIRLLVSSEGGAIDSIGMDDPVTMQYASRYLGMQMIEGASTMIAGVSPDRQRLVLIRPWETRRALAEIYVTGQTHHRIADICVVE